MRTEHYGPDDYSRSVAYVFDSVEELLDDVQTIPEERFGDNGYISIKDGRFIGRRFESWDDVYAAAQSVWSEGLEIVDRMLADLDGISLPRPTSRRRRTRFSEDDGDELDYDRFRDGRDFWRSSRRENTRGPATITVLVDVGANCGVKHSDILWRGAAAIALTKRLEEAGYRVELWTVHLAAHAWQDGCCDVDSFQAVCLKRPGDPLDISTLVAAVSGWFFRTAMLRIKRLGTLELLDGCGAHRDPRPVDLDFVSHDEHRVLIAGAFNYQDAVAQVGNVLETLSQK